MTHTDKPMTLASVRDEMVLVYGQSPGRVQAWIEGIVAELAKRREGEPVNKLDPYGIDEFFRVESPRAASGDVVTVVVDAHPQQRAQASGVPDDKSMHGLQPIETAPEETVIVVAWIDEDGCTRYEFEWLQDGTWHEHTERYDHYLSCAPRDIPCTGPPENAPYTHWLPLPILHASDSKELPAKKSASVPVNICIGVDQGSTDGDCTVLAHRNEDGTITIDDVRYASRTHRTHRGVQGMKTFWNIAALIAYGFVCGVSGAITVLFVLVQCIGDIK